MVSVGYDERWLQGKILIWMNEILREYGLPFEAVEQEVKISTPKGLRRYPDLIVWYKKPDKIACLIELKVPTIDVYSDDLVNDALQKAMLVGIPFFATWNLNKLVLWETFKPGTSLFDRRLKHWDVVDVKLPSDIERPEIEKAVKAFILEFLTELTRLYERKLPRPEAYVLPKLYPDDIMVLRLRSAVDSLYIPISLYILKKKEEDLNFRRKVGEWFVNQGWIFSGSEEDYDRLARQTVYLLINKLLFYNVLRSKFKLEPIVISDVTTSEGLKERLQRYFNTGIRLGYGIIFAADFLETIPIPDEAVDELKKLIAELNKYDFSEIGYDIIGKVFEKLIPKIERHKLGQYFTRTDVVDLILGFTVKHPNARVLDPACGSGTFLVRAYQRKKYLAEKLYREGRYDKPRKLHNEVINELWGVDIAKFPAHLSEINLVIRDLEALENRPNIVCRDFFEIQPGTRTLLYELAYKIPDMHEEVEVEFPAEFDAVVTNPPYTRQEEIEDMLIGGYKERLRALVKKMHKIDVGMRSSIYVYFFIHGGAFVRDGGRLGLVTFNSWLDVDFGKYLQEYFLRNFKIIAVIEPKYEKWFEDADVTAAITILERTDDPKERDENLVKFVQIKVPLRELIPEPGDVDQDRIRWEAIDKLVEFIEKTDKYYEDSRIRIFPKKQRELWDEGYDDEKERYVGSKWGKYIRAPEIFFKILQHGAEREILVPLKELAAVRRGFTTGSDEFFYLDNDRVARWGIERRYLHPVIISPRESKDIVIDKSKLKYKVLLVNEPKEELAGTNVLKYIEWGETQGFHLRDTCRSRIPWYALGAKEPGPILWHRRHYSRHIVFLNIKDRVYVDDGLFEIIPHNEKYVLPLAALLNSTMYAFLKFFYGRGTAGGRAIETGGIDIAKMPIIDLRKLDRYVIDKLASIFSKLLERPIENIESEVKKPDRRELDRLILVDILGLEDKDLEDLYKSVMDLVKVLIIRDNMKPKKTHKGPNVNAIATSLSRNFAHYLKVFPDEYVGNYRGEWEEINVPTAKRVELGSDIGGVYVKVNDTEIYRGWNRSAAEYIYYSILFGSLKVKIPKDKEFVEECVRKFKEDLDRMKDELNKMIEASIPDAKIREEVKSLVLRKVFEILKSRQRTTGAQ
ncbi:HsdM family class I SAM-dependent methyltransferase [Infirmifilum sp. SLHALR2]|nr:MAG: hypothetical protein B7L53_08290 [Thermofilum sp. NZ13]